MTRRLRNMVCITFLVLISTTLYADGVGVSASCSALPEGYRYYLTVYNGTAAGLGEYVWELHVNIVLPAAVEHPPLWEYVTVTSCSVDWATPSGNWSQGIPPGGTLSGFTFTAPSLAASLWYRAFTYNSSETGTYTGYAYPEPVPEPGGLAALAAGIGVLGLSTVRRRRAR